MMKNRINVQSTHKSTDCTRYKNINHTFIWTPGPKLPTVHIKV